MSTRAAHIAGIGSVNVVDRGQTSRGATDASTLTLLRSRNCSLEDGSYGCRSALLM